MVHWRFSFGFSFLCFLGLAQLSEATPGLLRPFLSNKQLFSSTLEAYDVWCTSCLHNLAKNSLAQNDVRDLYAYAAEAIQTSQEKLKQLQDLSSPGKKGGSYFLTDVEVLKKDLPLDDDESLQSFLQAQHDAFKARLRYDAQALIEQVVQEELINPKPQKSINSQGYQIDNSELLAKTLKNYLPAPLLENFSGKAESSRSYSPFETTSSGEKNDFSKDSCPPSPVLEGMEFPGFRESHTPDLLPKAQSTCDDNYKSAQENSDYETLSHNCLKFEKLALQHNLLLCLKLEKPLNALAKDLKDYLKNRLALRLEGHIVLTLTQEERLDLTSGLLQLGMHQSIDSLLLLPRDIMFV